MHNAVINSVKNIFRTGTAPAEISVFLRGNALIAAAAIVMLVALLAPPVNIAIDLGIAILLVFSLMLPIVVRYSTTIADVDKLPFLIVYITLMRLGLSVSAAKAVLTRPDAGTILSWFGPTYYGVYGLIAFGVIAAALFGFIYRAAQDLGDKTTAYLLTASSIAIPAPTRRFSASLAAASRLGMCDAILGFLIGAVATAGTVVIGSFGSASASAGPGVAMGMVLATAAPGLAIAAANILLARKQLFTAPHVTPAPNDDRPAAKVVESREISRPAGDDDAGLIEALSDSFSEAIAALDLANTQMLEFEGSRHVPADTVVMEIDQESPEGYYQTIIQCLHSLGKGAIVFAGNNIDDLPVTIPVNVGIRLAQAGKYCLLVDYDETRNAISKVFDIDHKSMKGKAIRTCIGNLWISPADGRGNTAAVPLAKKLRNAARAFDYTIIYAPNAGREELAYANSAIIFGSRADSPQLLQFQELMRRAGRKVAYESQVRSSKLVS